jgi:hypothetical protein
VEPVLVDAMGSDEVGEFTGSVDAIGGMLSGMGGGGVAGGGSSGSAIGELHRITARAVK